MSDNQSDAAGTQFQPWLRALDEARERVLASYVRYPFARGLRAEALPSDVETPEQKAARKAAKQARREKATADAIAAAIKAVDETQAKRVDPAQRPDFDTADPESSVPLPDNLKSATIAHPEWKRADGTSIAGKVIPFPLTPGGWRGVRTESGESFGSLVDRAIDKHISINRFPRDFDANDFSMARYCMAEQLSRTSHEGPLAFQKWAPKEHAFYEALRYYGKESKALGEMTSGQDGGFLAPEIWTNVFFDISGVACR